MPYLERNCIVRQTVPQNCAKGFKQQKRKSKSKQVHFLAKFSKAVRGGQGPVLLWEDNAVRFITNKG